MLVPLEREERTVLTMRRGWILGGLAAISMAALVGCSAAAPDPTVTVPSPSQTISLSPKPSPSSVSPSAVETDGSAYPYRAEIPLAVNADGTLGSGCTPPSGDTLPDGAWAAYVTEWGDDALTIDLVCYYSADSARGRDIVDECLASAPNAEEGCIYDLIENNNTRVREQRLAGDATLIDIYDTGEEVPMNAARTLEGWNSYEHDNVWLYINEGVITQIEPQFWP
jgi:hypothetical protein